MASCSAPKDCNIIQDDNSTVIQPVIHLIDYSPVLYQANFEVLKYHFSGLIAFRKVNDSDEIRIVLLSEVGLKLMEFSYTNRQIRNTYCSPAITKKTIPKFVGSFLETLVHTPECKSTCFFKEGNKSNYFCRAKSENVFVETYNEKRSIMKLRLSRKKGVSSSYIRSSELPEEIAVKMKYRTNINLKRVSDAFK